MGIFIGKERWEGLTCWGGIGEYIMQGSFGESNFRKIIPVFPTNHQYGKGLGPLALEV